MATPMGILTLMPIFWDVGIWEGASTEPLAVGEKDGGNDFMTEGLKAGNTVDAEPNGIELEKREASSPSGVFEGEVGVTKTKETGVMVSIRVFVRVDLEDSDVMTETSSVFGLIAVELSKRPQCPGEGGTHQHRHHARHARYPRAR